jgi:signal transduction histidine kinase
MRLADFILANLEPILQAWEEFAKTILPAAKPMNSAELRNQAEQMLRAIAADMRTSQTTEEQIAKSHGLGKRGKDDTAAETHALERLMSGFTIEQMVSEFRAMRASVLSLWSQRIKDGVEFELEDMTRFNEAVDQAIAESLMRFSSAVSESQHIFLGILGHDLRTPLGAISLGAEVLLRSEDIDSKHTKIVSRIYASVGRAKSIVDSLLDFTRSHFGGGIPIERTETDLTAICQNMVDEVRAYHPDRSILFEARQQLSGLFDADRMEQVFCNLIENAVQHGADTTPVTVSLHADESGLVFSVHNQGAAIPEKDISQIFNPTSLYSRHATNGNGTQSGLGLGLYIAHEIVTAHGGRIEVSSLPETGTTFTVRLPLGDAA